MSIWRHEYDPDLDEPSAPAPAAKPPTDERGRMTPKTMTAAEVVSRPVAWLWPARIPRGKITLLDGDPGLGKTTVLLDVAARVSNGRPMPGDDAGCARAPANVLYISVEDDWADTLRPRLEAAGADLARVHCWAAPGLPTLPSSIEEIGHLLVELEIALIILDPGVAFLDSGLNGNSDADVRKALAPLRGVCERTGAAAVLLRHLNKNQKSANALYRGGGSIAWAGAARSVLVAAKDPDDPERRILAATKASVGPLATSLSYRLHAVPVLNAGMQVRVEWLGRSDYEADDLLTTQRQGSSAARQECRRMIQEHLAGGATVARVVLLEEAEARGWGESIFKRACDDLGVTRTRENRARGGTLLSLEA